MPPRSAGATDDLSALASRLETMATDAAPPDVKSLLYRMFEGQKFVEYAVGKLAGELGLMRVDLNALRAKFRGSQRQIDLVTGEIEDTKSYELKLLRADRRKFIWLVIGAVVAGVIGALVHGAFSK